MEEAIIRFPHLGKQIFQKLTNKELTQCKIVGRNWRSFIDDEKLAIFAIIKKISNASNKSIWTRLKMQNEKESNIFTMNVIQVYKRFPKETGKVNPEIDSKNHYTTLHYAAGLPNLVEVVSIIMENLEETNPKTKCIVTIIMEFHDNPEKR